MGRRSRLIWLATLKASRRAPPPVAPPEPPSAAWRGRWTPPWAPSSAPWRGGLAGKATVEAIDPTVEDAYWRDRYASEPYYRDGYTYDDYAPAYGVGLGSTLTEQYRGRPFDEYESDLARDRDIYRGESRLTWPEASPAARAAWERAQRDRGAV